MDLRTSRSEKSSLVHFFGIMTKQVFELVYIMSPRGFGKTLKCI